MKNVSNNSPIEEEQVWYVKNSKHGSWGCLVVRNKLFDGNFYVRIHNEPCESRVVDCDYIIDNYVLTDKVWPNI